MNRAIAIVEGKTEESFVKELLRPRLIEAGLDLRATQIGEPGRKGGQLGYPRVQREILKHLKQERRKVVTTMVDLYALPSSWPGRDAARQAPPPQKAGVVEQAVLADIAREMGGSFDPRRFVPYVQLHEFEALLFAAPAAVCGVLQQPEREADLEQVRSEFASPEEIDEGPDTAPSKRLARVFPGYRKATRGILAALRIGLPAMRAACPHFHAWVTALEALGSAAPPAPGAA